MWNRKKELKENQRHGNRNNTFLSYLTSHLYQTELEEDDEFEDLYILEETHFPIAGADAYFLEAKKEFKDDYSLHTPMFIFRLMQYLLEGFAVVTSVQDRPIDPLLIEEMANYRLVPQRFVSAYVRFSNSSPREGERVYYDGKEAMLTLTDGMNRGVVEPFYTTPGNCGSICLSQTAYSKELLGTSPSDYADIEKYCESSDCFFTLNYNMKTLHMILEHGQFSEEQMLSKLRAFCEANGKRLCVMWPEDPALR